MQISEKSDPSAGKEPKGQVTRFPMPAYTDSEPTQKGTLQPYLELNHYESIILLLRRLRIYGRRLLILLSQPPLCEKRLRSLPVYSFGAESGCGGLLLQLFLHSQLFFHKRQLLQLLLFSSQPEPIRFPGRFPLQLPGHCL